MLHGSPWRHTQALTMNEFETSCAAHDTSAALQSRADSTQGVPALCIYSAAVTHAR